MTRHAYEALSLHSFALTLATALSKAGGALVIDAEGKVEIALFVTIGAHVQSIALRLAVSD